MNLPAPAREIVREKGLKPLLRLFHSTEKKYEKECETGSDDRLNFLGNLRVELAQVIVRIREPKTTTEILNWKEGNETLIEHALVYLIQRDAEEEYDQIEGFIDMVFMGELSVFPPGLNGSQLCDWVMKNEPTRPS